MLELDEPAQPAGIDRIWSIPNRRHGVPYLKEFAQTRRLRYHVVYEADAVLQPGDDKPRKIHKRDHFPDRSLAFDCQKGTDDDELPSTVNVVAVRVSTL